MPCIWTCTPPQNIPQFYFSKDFRQASDLPTLKCEKIPCFQNWSYQLSSIFKDFLAHTGIGVKMSHSVESFLRENDSSEKFMLFTKCFYDDPQTYTELRPDHVECFLRGWNCLNNFCARSCKFVKIPCFPHCVSQLNKIA